MIFTKNRRYKPIFKKFLALKQNVLYSNKLYQKKAYPFFHNCKFEFDNYIFLNSKRAMIFSPSLNVTQTDAPFIKYYVKNQNIPLFFVSLTNFHHDLNFPPKKIIALIRSPENRA